MGFWFFCFWIFISLVITPCLEFSAFWYLRDGVSSFHSIYSYRSHPHNYPLNNGILQDMVLHPQDVNSHVDLNNSKICFLGGIGRLELSHKHYWYFVSSVLFSYSVMSNSLWHHGLQYASLRCPLLELAQTHVYRVSDAIQSSHSLSSPSPHAFNLSQHQGLFQWVTSLHQVVKVFEFQIQCQSFQWIFRTYFL